MSHYENQIEFDERRLKQKTSVRDELRLFLNEFDEGLEGIIRVVNPLTKAKKAEVLMLKQQEFNKKIVRLMELSNE